jgi:hypothetical protein
VEPRNTPAGCTARAEEGFRCVTTAYPVRPGCRATPSPPTPYRLAEAVCLAPHFAVALRVPPPRVSRALQTPHAAAVAAASLASDAPAASTRALGNTVGSTARLDTSAHTPCADKSAIPAAGLWRASLLRWYAAHVPWEVTTPWGRPGRMHFILLGHSALDALSLLACPRATSPPRTASRRSPKETREARRDPATGQAVKQRRTPGRRRTRDALDLKNTRKEDHPTEAEASRRRGKENQGRITSEGHAPRRQPPARD